MLLCATLPPSGVRVHIGALINVPVVQALDSPTGTPPDGTPHPRVEHDVDGFFGKRVTNGNIAASVSEEGLVTITRVSDHAVLLRQTAQRLTPPHKHAATAPADQKKANCSILPNTSLAIDDSGGIPKPHVRSTPTAAACAARCLAEPACYAYTWVSNGTACHLKGARATAPGPSNRHAEAAHTSGICREGSPPSPPAAFVQTGTAHVAFDGLAEGEGIYGMGEHRGGDRCDNLSPQGFPQKDQCVNTTLPIRQWSWDIQHSQDQRVLANNGNAWVPFYQSSKGYGFLWNLASYGHFHVGRDAITWSSNATLQIDYWVTTTAAATLADTPPYADLMKHCKTPSSSIR